MSTGEIVPRELGTGLVEGPFRIPAPQGDAVRAATASTSCSCPGWRSPAAERASVSGGGHYDRFLAALPAGCLTVGVCFAEQLVDELPVEPHDRPVDVVVSDGTPD